jgi:hypothetical protein
MVRLVDIQWPDFVEFVSPWPPASTSAIRVLPTGLLPMVTNEMSPGSVDLAIVYQTETNSSIERFSVLTARFFSII